MPARPTTTDVTPRADPAAERLLGRLLAVELVARLLYPFFNSPLSHLFSDPQRHWDNGGRFLDPSIMGSSDPYLYQVWIFAWRSVTHDDAAALCLAAGVLCAAMPYGWYRALREISPRRAALTGALIIGAVPESISLYGYFMNETLLASLLGFGVWLALRARRKQTLGAFAVAAAVWTGAAFTRTVAVPLALGFTGWLIVGAARRTPRVMIAAALALAVAIPSGLHARAKLHYFAPFGNLYFNEIYSISGAHDIAVDYGADGRYQFGCPSFYNPTFQPFSGWTTARTGVVSIAVNPALGRAPWIGAKAAAARGATFPSWRARAENAIYLLFGQSWPYSDRANLVGWLTYWTRWVWTPVILAVAYTATRGRFSGAAWALPLAGLGTLAFLLMQSEAVMEARYRMPIDAFLIASLVCARRPRPTARASEGAHA